MLQTASNDWPKLDTAQHFYPQTQQETTKQVEALLMTLSTEQKVAQMIQPEIRWITPEQMQQYGFGSYLNGGGSFPNNQMHASVAEWQQLADDYYLATLKHFTNQPAIPPIWGTDAVHGHNNVRGATLFPHNIGLGATRNTDLIRKIGEATAKEVRATAIDWAFAPTIAVAKDLRWGRSYESYSHDPQLVQTLGLAMVEGLQGQNEAFLDQHHVLATAKHFIGDGGTKNGVDQGDALMDESTLVQTHALGYFSALEAGVQTVMASFNSWNGEKNHGSHYLLTDVLKQRLNFRGLVVGDWNGHGQIPGCTDSDCAQAINAGVDILMVPEAWHDLYHNTIAQVKSGEIAIERINDAVRRILTVKVHAGLFDLTLPSQRPGAQASAIGHSTHRTLARQAVRESLVLLKNQQNTLPLSPKQRVLITGIGADNLPMQAGGWSVTWQGTNVENSDFPGATSLGQALQAQITAAGGQATITSDLAGVNTQAIDVAIVIFGESPYAEGDGDLKHLEFIAEEETHLAIMKQLNAQNIPVVAVFLTGRPLWVNPELNQADAFVVAWLPGTEGAGVADVLLSTPQGKIQHDFQGQLSFDWPATPNLTEPPLFPFGYGLTYQQQSTSWQPLDESAQIEQNRILQADIMTRRLGQGLTLWLGNERSLGMKINANHHVLPEQLVSVRSINYQLQEDAKQLFWNSPSPSGLIFQVNNHNRWQQAFANTAHLSFELRLDQGEFRPLTIVLTDSDKHLYSLPITQERLSRTDKKGQWFQIRISLQEFQLPSTFQPQQIRLFSQGQHGLSLANIRLL